MGENEMRIVDPGQATVLLGTADGHRRGESHKSAQVYTPTCGRWSSHLNRLAPGRDESPSRPRCTQENSTRRPNNAMYADLVAGDRTLAAVGKRTHDQLAVA